MSFTPGPWTHDGYERVRPVDGAQDGTNDICHVYQKCGNQQLANASLIAAAPDLLAACKREVANTICICKHLELVATSDDDDTVCDRCKTAAAIFKATGESL